MKLFKILIVAAISLWVAGVHATDKNKRGAVNISGKNRNAVNLGKVSPDAVKKLGSWEKSKPPVPSAPPLSPESSAIEGPIEPKKIPNLGQQRQQPPAPTPSAPPLSRPTSEIERPKPSAPNLSQLEDDRPSAPTLSQIEGQENPKPSAPLQMGAGRLKKQ